MSQPTSTRRHPNVINVSEADGMKREKGTRFGATFKQLAVPTGGQGLGCGWYEVEPGKTAMPRHYHCSTEEAVFVLEGRGSLRIGDATVVIGPGDYISFPVGPSFAHQITNDGDAPLRYLGLSNRPTVDVVGYPDSKKIMAVGSAAGTKWNEPQWVRIVVKDDAGVDYYEGERID